MLKVDIGGLSGLVAPLVGKQPPDSHVWILDGDVPGLPAIAGADVRGRATLADRSRQPRVALPLKRQNVTLTEFEHTDGVAARQTL